MTNHDHIILIAMTLGGLIAFPFGYWKGKAVGEVEGRLAYRKLERAKSESQ